MRQRSAYVQDFGARDGILDRKLGTIGPLAKPPRAKSITAVPRANTVIVRIRSLQCFHGLLYRVLHNPIITLYFDLICDASHFSRRLPAFSQQKRVLPRYFNLLLDPLNDLLLLGTAVWRLRLPFRELDLDLVNHFAHLPLDGGELIYWLRLQL